MPAAAGSLVEPTISLDSAANRACSTAHREAAASHRASEIIRRPCHMWEFEISTGRSLVDPKAWVKTYPVVVEVDMVVVYAEPKDLPPEEATATQM